MRENGYHSHRAIGDDNKEGALGIREVMTSQVGEYLKEVKCQWKKAQRAWTTFHTEMDITEKAKKCITAKGWEDLSVWGLQQYLEAKYDLLQCRGENGAIIPTDNVLHSMWSRVDVTMNGEVVSTTSLKYMYKSYVRRNLAVHCSVTPFIIRQPIWRPHLLERVFKPMRTSH